MNSTILVQADIEERMLSAYIPLMVKLLITLVGIVILSASVITQESGEDDIINPLPVIINLDREISALFDAYLQAVPRCPMEEGSEVDNWIIDLAFLRANKAYQYAVYLPHSPDSILNTAWMNYLNASLQYIEIFAVIQKAYHNTVDSAASVYLENELILCDSIWSVSETALFQILAEKGITYEQSE